VQILMDDKVFCETTIDNLESSTKRETANNLTTVTKDEKIGFGHTGDKTRDEELQQQQLWKVASLEVELQGLQEAKAEIQRRREQLERFMREAEAQTQRRREQHERDRAVRETEEVTTWGIIKMAFGYKTRRDRAREEELQHLQQQLQQQQRLWEVAQIDTENRRMREQQEGDKVSRKLEAAMLAEEVVARDAELEEERRIQHLYKRKNARLKSLELENLRVLRDNIRRKYQLDIYIWARRGVRKPDRPLVEKKIEEADALLEEILSVVKGWEEGDNIFNADKWQLAEQIKERLLRHGKRLWANNPPWFEN